MPLAKSLLVLPLALVLLPDGAVAAGPAPAPASEAATTPAPVATGSVTGSVNGERKKDDVWVAYIDAPTGAPWGGLDKRKYAINQRNAKFEPSTLIVPKGAKVDFPNADRFYHNVFSVSPGNRFDLGLYRGGASKSTHLNKPGVIDVYCNIHPHMHASVLVVPSPHFVEVGADGKFKLEGIPAGSYPLVVWSADHKPQRIEVVIPPNGNAKSVAIDLGKRVRRAAHMNKSGGHYGTYK